MSNTNGVHVLSLNDLSLKVHLGCEAVERLVPQEVRVSVEVRWPEAPMGEVSDELSDTVCYAELANALTQLCEGREFKLIETLASESLRVVRTAASAGPLIGLCVHKVRPPVPHLLGGAKYYCGDFRL